MRSNDRRYFQVRRTKRVVNLYPEVADALSMVRKDRSIAPVLYHLVRQSAAEYTHVMLACGRTSTDFRRNFRRGAARHNQIPASDIAPHGALLVDKFDGYTLFRLTKEQYWNLKERSGKVRLQDAVIHDPQGQWWSLLLHFSLGGPKAENVNLLRDLRKMAVRLFDPNSEEDFAKHVTKALERHDRYLAKATAAFPERLPQVSRRLAQSNLSALERWLDLDMRSQHVPELRAQVRIGIEKALVVLEAYTTGGDVRRAALDPDTSQRHCSAATLRVRIAHVINEIGRNGLLTNSLIQVKHQEKS